MKYSGHSRRFDPLTGGRRYHGAMKKDTEKEWVPPWAREPVLADEPLLPQLEQKLLKVDDEGEFRRGLEWLSKHFYLDPDKRDMLEGMGLKDRWKGE